MSSTVYSSARIEPARTQRVTLVDLIDRLLAGGVVVHGHIRLAVADIVATASLPEEIKGDWAAYTGCMAGASEIDELEKMLRNAGFNRIKVAPKDASRSFIREWLPGKRIEEYLVSATIEATRPLHS